MVTVNVKFHSNCSILIDVDAKSNLGDIRTEISKKLNVPLEEVRVILGGKLLTDDCELQDLDLGDQSTLHIFRQSAEKETRSEACNTSRLKNQYFVYCKECKAVKPGKLRVVCSACKDGAFVLERDPESWSDVLQATQIGGSCKNADCRGTSAEFHFKCAEPHSEDTYVFSVVLHHVRPNRREIECITCADVKSPVLVFPCTSGHVMCLDCFTVYGVTQLSERKFVKHQHFGYTLPCPAGCPDSEIQESHHFHLLGDEQYERFNRFATEEYVLQDGGVLCPGPGCGMGFVLDAAERKVTCVAKDCQMVFCRDCKDEYHEGPCDVNPLQQLPSQVFTVDPDLADRARWETQSRSLIERTTKPCPKCSTRTERDGGCMHMLCPRCGENWCWVCDKAWDRDCQGEHWFG